MKVLVLGDTMLDEYVFGECTRISPEAPVPILLIKKKNTMLGGAGNVLRNLTSLGVATDFLSVTGNDLNYNKVLELLNQNEANTNAILFKDSERITTVKYRYVASNQQILRVDQENSSPISQPIENHLLKNIEARIGTYDAIVISDYDKGVVTKKVLTCIIKLARQNEIPVFVDPKKDNFLIYKGCTLLKPNFKEFTEACYFHGIDLTDFKMACKKLADLLEIRYLIVTKGEEGIFAYHDNTLVHSPAIQSEVYDVSGAGDTVLAGLVYCLLNGNSLDYATRFSNIAASIVIKKFGSATTNVQDILKNFA